MDILDRLEVGNILIGEFERLAHKLDPSEEELLSVVIKKANSVKFKMMMCYEQWDRPPEFMEQIERMDFVIKKLEKMQNKHVTGM